MPEGQRGPPLSFIQLVERKRDLNSVLETLMNVEMDFYHVLVRGNGNLLDSVQRPDPYPCLSDKLREARRLILEVSQNLMSEIKKMDH